MASALHSDIKAISLADLKRILRWVGTHNSNMERVIMKKEETLIEMKVRGDTLLIKVLTTEETDQKEDILTDTNRIHTDIRHTRVRIKLIASPPVCLIHHIIRFQK